MASLVAHLVQNPPAMWETWVQSLGWEDPLEKGKATHSSILVWRIPHMILAKRPRSDSLENSMDWIAHGIAKSWT